jgi:hypothetical protein
MARHKIYAAYHPLIFFVLLLVLVLVLPAKFLSSTSSWRQEVYIDGRWKAVRSSLGLPPLPDTIIFDHPSVSIDIRVPATAARFDLKRKRAEYVAMDERAQLHFSADALHEPSISHERLLESLHAITLSEKENASEQRRASTHQQGQRNRRRPSSWTTQEGKRTQNG